MISNSNNDVTISRRTLSTVAALLGVAGFIMLATMLLYQRAAISEPSEPFILPVSVALVSQQSSYSATEYYAGRVEALRDVNLAFEQPGKVTELFVDEGAVVQKDEKLASQDTLILEASREQTSASVDRIKTQLELAELTEARRKQLFEQGHVNEQQYDEARLNTQTLQAQLKEVQAALESIDVNIEKSILYAPFDGVIGQRFVDEGGVINAGAPVLNLQEQGIQLARISMPTSRASQMDIGALAKISIGERLLEAKVYAVRADVNPQTRTQDVLYQLPANSGVAIGALVELSYEATRTRDGYWMPAEALVEGNKGLWNIFEIVAKDGAYVVERRSVEIIHAETGQVFVAANMGDESNIVRNGTHRIVPGQKVSPKTIEEQ